MINWLLFSANQVIASEFAPWVLFRSGCNWIRLEIAHEFQSVKITSLSFSEFLPELHLSNQTYIYWYSKMRFKEYVLFILSN